MLDRLVRFKRNSGEICFPPRFAPETNYTGPLRARLGSRHLKVDLTRGELILHSPSERPLLASYSDYLSGITLPTYTLEEVLAEKLCALMGRTEPRDLYDVHWLLERGDVDIAFLTTDFAAKCQHKGHDPQQLANALSAKERTFRRLWTSRLEVQVQDLPALKEVLRVVRRLLRSQGMV